MKTTIDIPDPLYRAVRIRAAEGGMTLREVVLQAIEKEIYPSSHAEGPDSRQTKPDNRGTHFTIDEMGLPILKRAAGDGVAVTNEFIDGLRDKEGV